MAHKKKLHSGKVMATTIAVGAAMGVFTGIKTAQNADAVEAQIKANPDMKLKDVVTNLFK